MQQLDEISSLMFLRERAEYRPHLISVYFLEGGMTESASSIRAHILSCLADNPAFAVRLAKVPMRFGHPFWAPLAAIDADTHIRFRAVSGRGDWQALRSDLVELLEAPMDPTRPLWEVHVLTGFEDESAAPGGRTIVAVKVHHGVMDGLGLARFAGHLFTEAAMHPQKVNGTRANSAPPIDARVRLRTAARNAAAQFLGFPRELTSLRNLKRRYDASVARGERPGIRQTAPGTVFNGPTQGRRVFNAAWFPLKEVQALRTLAPGATLNDVALTVIAGAIREYLSSKGTLPDEALLCGVPMSLRNSEEPVLGNTLTGLCVDLHTNVADPIDRLHRISGSSYWEKQRVREFGAVIGSGALALKLPPFILDLILKGEEAAAVKGERVTGANTVVTNIPRSRHVRYFATSRVLRTCGLISLNPGIGLKHEISSLGDLVSISVLANSDQLDAPDFYIQCLSNEFGRLMSARATEPVR
ncbi:wax ester/triacylglycerol synthase domain-containing protein [Hoyosella subflava]|uniref:wax ester/triacylglycerol synthase domain-containing protein n=1 Tax=Hoyosella subflava TaxID=639313 RepID=UPI0013052027|nr:wax ester/triacylglycerol synthase domain-containing protein [Hoyosella subflava]